MDGIELVVTRDEEGGMVGDKGAVVMRGAVVTADGDASDVWCLLDASSHL